MTHSLPKRVLLVEDELGVRLTLAGNLELEGFEVVEAAHAQDALEVLRSDLEVDVVLSDIQMPGMSGVELAQRARRLRPHVPVVLMTAYSDDDHLQRGYGYGVYTVLPKPFDVARAIRTVQRACEQPKVLVVDDEATYARTLCEALRAVGLSVIEATDGAGALEAVLRHDVDVCLTDLRMPGVDGVEVADRIRASGRPIHVIVFSGYDEQELMAQAAERGVFACLRKPVDVPHLLRVIADARSGVRVRRLQPEAGAR